jgi:small subunit ribosomal protein S17
MAEEETTHTTAASDSGATAAGQPPKTASQDARAAARPAATSPAESPVAQEVLAPKERRQRSRAAKAAKTKATAPRTPEQRQADRVAERAEKAQLRRAGRAKAAAKAKAQARPTVATQPREHVGGVQKLRQGVVVSDKADKTITVRIDTARRHRRYSKVVRTSRTLHAHDERNDAHIGDTVVVRESRPLSRSKRWRLVQVIARAR